jgi:cytochrome P450
MSKMPPGPAETYDPKEKLIEWLDRYTKQYGAIFKASIYGTDAYVVSDPALVEHVLRRNWRNYKKGQAIKRIAFLLGNGLMVSEGELWKRQRQIVQQAFSKSSLKQLVPIVIGANARLKSKWLGAADRRESVNVTHDISQTILEIVLKSIFGDDYEKIAPHFEIFDEESGRHLQFAQAFRGLGQHVLTIARDRMGRGEAGADIMGLLLCARDPETAQPMADALFVNEILTLVVAGHETTASTLNWTWYLLSQHAEVGARMAAEISQFDVTNLTDPVDLKLFPYTQRVIEEALRLYPPGWLMTRCALADDWLGEYFVPAGTEIYISPYLIQRRPDLWEAPENFDPDRFDNALIGDRHVLKMLPFSAGPRNCIGEAFARIEMQLHLMLLVPWIKLSYLSSIRPELAAEVNLRSKQDFMMVPERRL